MSQSGRACPDLYAMAWTASRESAMLQAEPCTALRR
jgi:hypothetical protein